MSSDPDSCIPTPLKDFVFDLHDSVRNSHIPSEQNTLYTGTFRSLTSKYFGNSAWPSPASIADECGSDALFLALYKELTQRHLHSISRVSLQDRIEGWHVYRSLFDLLLEEAEKKDQHGIYMVPEWTFDILHEFVYQFQGFCQFRSGVFGNATKYGSGGQLEGKSPPHHLTEHLDGLSQNKDAWAVETVLFYLHRIVSIGKDSGGCPPAFSYMGIFASVTLSRLECLLGDYASSLSALDTLSSSQPIPPPKNDEDGTPLLPAEIVQSVFAAQLSMSYHAGVSYLLLRRYRDAAQTLGTICSTLSRGFKAGSFKSISGHEQFYKLYERMIALLAIVTHACPAQGLVEDSIARVVRDKHGSQLSKIEAGEEGYEDLFIFACPKFISPSVPPYELVMEGASGSVTGPMGTDAYKLQVQHFMNEMASQQTMRKLRSYMKLYTSIEVEKLGRLVLEDEVLPLLISYKHKMRQIEKGEDGEDKIGTVMDIHYHIKNDVVHVDEAEKQHRFENYFMSQISQSNDIIKDIEAISLKI